MQKVNLYQDEFKTRRDWTSTGIRTGIILFILSIVCTNIYQGYRNHVLDNHYQTVQQTLTDRQAAYTALAEQSRTAGENSDLEKEYQRLIRDIDSKRRVLNYLTGKSQVNTVGFSLLLRGLGRQLGEFNDVWLQGVRFHNGGYKFRLDGKSLVAEKVPELLQSLSNEEIYKGFQFSTMKMSRSGDSNILDFVLDTEQDNSQGDGGNTISLEEFLTKLRNLSEKKNANI